MNPLTRLTRTHTPGVYRVESDMTHIDVSITLAWRDIPDNWNIARCHWRCDGQAWTWPAVECKRDEFRCPSCGGFTDKTSRQYRGRFFALLPGECRASQENLRSARVAEWRERILRNLSEREFVNEGTGAAWFHLFSPRPDSFDVECLDALRTLSDEGVLTFGPSPEGEGYILVQEVT